MDRNQYYLFLASEDSSEYFPNNKGYDFTIELPRILELEGKWECALINFSTDKKSEDLSDMYVFCDIVQESYVRNSNLPILTVVRYVTKRKFEHNLTVDHVLYHKISRSNISSLRIYITDSDLNNVSLLTGTSKCILHLRKTLK